jgi:putative salt-induced outer membrane protein YdiY
VATVRRIRVVIVAGALVLVAAPRALAQAPAPAPEPPPRVEASAQFAFLNTTGNAPTQSLGTGGDITWRPGLWTHTAKAAFAQNESEDVIDARSVTGLFRSSRQFKPRLSGYAQYDYLRDAFAGVDQRHIIEGGVSFKAVETARHRLRLDTGIGYLNEQGPGRELETATWSVGAGYRLAISKTADFTYEPRYLLTLADTGAWKFDQAAALAVAINSIFSLKASHVIRYSASPPFGFETTDTIMAVSLVAKIKRP